MSRELRLFWKRQPHSKSIFSHWAVDQYQKRPRVGSNRVHRQHPKAIHMRPQLDGSFEAMIVSSVACQLTRKVRGAQRLAGHAKRVGKPIISLLYASTQVMLQSGEPCEGRREDKSMQFNSSKTTSTTTAYTRL